MGMQNVPEERKAITTEGATAQFPDVTVTVKTMFLQHLIFGKTRKKEGRNKEILKERVAETDQREKKVSWISGDDCSRRS